MNRLTIFISCHRTNAAEVVELLHKLECGSTTLRNVFCVPPLDICSIRKDEEHSGYEKLPGGIKKDDVIQFVFCGSCRHVTIYFDTIFAEAQSSICKCAEKLRDLLTQPESHCTYLLDCTNRGIDMCIMIVPSRQNTTVSFLKDYQEQMQTGILYSIVYNKTKKRTKETISGTVIFMSDNRMYWMKNAKTKFMVTALSNSLKLVEKYQAA